MSEAITATAREAALEIVFSIEGETESNRFAQTIGGREGLTEAEAKAEVFAMATRWVADMRTQGFAIAAWDAAGNHF
jgi:hypothetical protein